MKKQIVILSFLLILPIIIFAYNTDDFISDCKILLNEKMNKIQKDAAQNRIKLFIHKYTNKEINDFLKQNNYKNELLIKIERIIKTIRPSFELTSTKKDYQTPTPQANNNTSKETKQKTKTTDSDSNDNENEEDTASSQDDMINFVEENYTSSSNKDEEEIKDSQEKETNSNDSQTYLKGYNNYIKGEYNKAIQLLEQIPAKSKNYQNSIMILGDIYYLQKQYNKALKKYSILMIIIKNNKSSNNDMIGFCYKRTGIIYFHIKSYNKSIIHLSRGFELIPFDNEILYYLGYSYHLKDMNEEALKYWELGKNNGDNSCTKAYLWLKKRI